ncbi:MAG: hypothetical protein H9Q65_05430 [Spiroplasma ixodetis]|nr:hypothetical protein [Spiroplasma ixodetis]MBP1528665.1 hypothetical protein [Spiroplasma ixodetis]
MLKKNWIKKRLNNIEKNNLELLKFKFLKETMRLFRNLCIFVLQSTS